MKNFDFNLNDLNEKEKEEFIMKVIKPKSIELIEIVIIDYKNKIDVLCDFKEKLKTSKNLEETSDILKSLNKLINK